MRPDVMSVFKKRGRKRNRGWNKGPKQSCVRKLFTPNTQNVIEKEAASSQLANMASYELFDMNINEKLKLLAENVFFLTSE